MAEWPLLRCYGRYQKATVTYKFSSDEEAQRLELIAYVVRWVGQWEAAFYWSLVWFPVEKAVCNCAFESWLGRTKKMSWQNDTLTGFLGCYDDAPRIATVNSQNATVIFSKCYYQVFCWVGNSVHMYKHPFFLQIFSTENSLRQEHSHRIKALKYWQLLIEANKFSREYLLYNAEVPITHYSA